MSRSLNSQPALPKRPYGNTGIELSVVGFGGLLLKHVEQQDANRLVADAIERGVNYFDVAPTYGDAEERLGPALEPFRKAVFLACKTVERSRQGAAAELKRSLSNLRTDYFDLYQLHGLGPPVDETVDEAFKKDGALETLIEARKAGIVRHLGFSAHTETAALTAMQRYDFDSVMFPFNFACWYQNGLGPRVLERATEQGMACIALKTFARQVWPEEDPLRKQYQKCWYQPITNKDEASLALRFSLGLGVTSALTPGDESMLHLALESAGNIAPLTSTEEDTLRALARKLKPVFS